MYWNLRSVLTCKPRDLCMEVSPSNAKRFANRLHPTHIILATPRMQRTCRSSSRHRHNLLIQQNLVISRHLITLSILLSMTMGIPQTSPSVNIPRKLCEAHETHRSALLNFDLGHRMRRCTTGASHYTRRRGFTELQWRQLSNAVNCQLRSRKHLYRHLRSTVSNLLRGLTSICK
jgi:hypothetical protein